MRGRAGRSQEGFRRGEENWTKGGPLGPGGSALWHQQCFLFSFSMEGRSRSLFFFPRRRGSTSAAGAVRATSCVKLLQAFLLLFEHFCGHYSHTPPPSSHPHLQVVSCCLMSRAAWASCPYPRRPKWHTVMTICPWRIFSLQPAPGREAGRDPCIEGPPWPAGGREAGRDPCT